MENKSDIIKIASHSEENPQTRQDCQYLSLAVFKYKSRHPYPHNIHYQLYPNRAWSSQSPFRNDDEACNLSISFSMPIVD
jgi:hypothetical protein